MPAARRLYYALEILSEPTLVEPIFSSAISLLLLMLWVVSINPSIREEVLSLKKFNRGTPLNTVTIYLFRSNLTCLFPNPSVSLVCLEETLKERPSLKLSSTIGRSLRVFLCLIKKPLTSFWVSERERTQARAPQVG